MKMCFYFLFVLSVAFVTGCGESPNRTVTDGADQQALADYEAELAAVTGEDIEEALVEEEEAE